MNVFLATCVIGFLLCQPSHVADALLFQQPHNQDCQRCYDCECNGKSCSNLSNCRQSLPVKNCYANSHQDGGWTQWTQWNACTGACVYALRERFRTCTSPIPQNCGQTCEGPYVEIDNTCKPFYCGGSIASSTASTKPNTSPATSPTISPRITTQPTSALSTVTSTPPTLSTTTAAYQTCGKLCTVSAVTEQRQVMSAHTRMCADFTRRSSEALVAHCCGHDNTTQLGMGPNVMSNCLSFPRYSPVASFSKGILLAGSAGIFLGCLQPPEIGFQIIRQSCTDVPSLIHVNSTSPGLIDPSTYFALV